MPDLSEYSRKWRPASHALPIVAAALLGLAVAVSAWFAVSVWEQRLARAKFNAVAGNYASILQNGLDDFLANIPRSARSTMPPIPSIPANSLSSPVG